LDREAWPVSPAGEEEMINEDEWAEIRRLHFAEGLGLKSIARRLGVARNTVRRGCVRATRLAMSGLAARRRSTGSTRRSAGCWVILQEGRVLQVAHAVSSTPWPGLSYNEHVRPRGADPGDTPRFAPPSGPGHFQNADVRLDPDIVPFGGGNEAWVAAWLRPLDRRPIDAAWLVAMCDMLPPALFTRTTGPVKAATIEYVVHLATGEPFLPAGDHVYLSCRSPLSSEGFAVEDATMWGPDGQVFAVARQTRLAGL
jgi:hypothetical protein